MTGRASERERETERGMRSNQSSPGKENAVESSPFVGAGEVDTDNEARPAHAGVFQRAHQLIQTDRVLPRFAARLVCILKARKERREVRSAQKKTW